MRKIILSTCLFAVLATRVVAGDIEVKTAQELYDAINSANNGDTILIDASARSGVIDLHDITDHSLPDPGVGNKNLTIKTKDGTVVTITGDGKPLFATLGTSTGMITFENVNFSKGENVDSAIQGGGGGVFENPDPANKLILVFQGNDTLLFEDNSSTYKNTTGETQSRGGGALSYGQAGFDTSLGDVVFRNNATDYSSTGTIDDEGNVFAGGGAIYLTDMEIYNTGDITFENNKAVFNVDNTPRQYTYLFGGGAIFGGDYDGYSSQTFGNTGDVLFIGNEAYLQSQGGTGVVDSNGGGGAIMSGTQSFENGGDVIFRDNLAKNDDGKAYTWGGGAISGGQQTFSNQGDVIYQGNTAENSQSAYAGALMYMVSDGQTYQNAGNVLFQDNHTEGQINSYGGAIYGQGQVQQLFQNTGDVQFLNNRAVAQTGTASGGVLWAMDTLFDNDGDVDFCGNYVHGVSAKGGAIYYVNHLDFSQSRNLYFRDNYAIATTADSGSGGAIHSVSVSDLMTVQNDGHAFFTDNMTTGLGGAYYSEGGTLTLAPKFGKSVIFQGNKQHVTFNDLTPDTSTGALNSLYLAKNTIINLTPEAYATISFFDPIQSTNAAGTNNSMVLNGPGKVKVYENSDYHGSTAIDDGFFFMIKQAQFGGGGTLYHDFTLQSAATIGISVDPSGSHSVLHTNTFEAFENADGSGPGLYVPGVALLPASDQERVYENVIISNDATKIQSVDLVDHIVTPLMEAYLRVNADDPENGDLVIVWTKDMSDVYVFHPHVDILRKKTPTDTPLGDIFDIIYHTPVDFPEIDECVVTNTGEPILNAINGMAIDSEIFSRIMRERSRDLSPCCRIPLCADDFERCDDGRWSRIKNRSGVTRWGMFTQNWSTFNGSVASHDMTYRPAYATFGAERVVGNRLFGWAGQYVHADSRAGNSSYTNLQMNAIKVGVYASWQDARKYVKGNIQAGAGWNEERTYYAIPGGTYRDTFAAGIAGMSVEAGLSRCFGDAARPWQLSPHVGFNLYYVGTESFRESPDEAAVASTCLLARRFDGLDYVVGELPVGVRLSKTFAVENGLVEWLRPTLDANYVRSFCDGTPSTTVGFADDPTITWRQSGTHLGRDIFRLSAGLTSRLPHNLDLRADYGLEWRNNYHAHQVFASLAKTW